MYFLVSARRLGSFAALAFAALAFAALTLSPKALFAEEPTHQYDPCTREPSDSEIAAAKGAFQAGQASFNEADYPRAIVYWEDAYRRDCTAHALLLNLARAFELHGQKRQAVVALQTYLDRKPDPAQVSAINRRIEVLSAQIQKEEQEAAAAAPPVPPPAATSQPVEPPPPQPDAPSGGRRPIAPLIVAGAGGVALVAGVIIWAGANSDLKAVEDQCGEDRQCPEGPDQSSLIEQGENARKRVTTASVISLVGLGATAGGLIWYFLSPPSGGSSAKLPGPKLARPRVDPLLGPGFAGLSVTGSF